MIKIFSCTTIAISVKHFISCQNLYLQCYWHFFDFPIKEVNTLIICLNFLKNFSHSLKNRLRKKICWDSILRKVEFFGNNFLKNWILFGTFYFGGNILFENILICESINLLSPLVLGENRFWESCLTQSIRWPPPYRCHRTISRFTEQIASLLLDNNNS